MRRPEQLDRGGGCGFLVREVAITTDVCIREPGLRMLRGHVECRGFQRGNERDP
jgi:hypothetical protein